MSSSEPPPTLADLAERPGDMLPPKRGEAGKGVTIALVSGSVFRHPWFEGAVELASDSVAVPWGTMVAGFVLQRAPAARLIDCGPAMTSDSTSDGAILAALAEARKHKPDLIVITLGADAPGPPSRTFTRIVQTFDCPILAAAGNTSDGEPAHPANVPGVVAVGGLLRDPDTGWARSPYSSKGEVYAPCVDVLSTTVVDNVAGYGWAGGTMVSAGLVAGEVAAAMTRLGVSAREALEEVQGLPPDAFLEPLDENAAAEPRRAGPTGLADPTTAVNDYWTTADRLGYRVHADALASFIRDQGTKPPLAVAVKGAWGSGKTSLLRMVQERIDRKESITLTKDAQQDLTTVSKREPRLSAVFGLLRRSDLTPVVENKNSPVGTPVRGTELRVEQSDGWWRPTVWFNPWMYQTGEQVWAGLAHEIVHQTTGRMSTVDRERFWLALNLSRVDREAVRRRIYRAVLTRLLPAALATLVALLIGLALITMGQTAWGTGVVSLGGATVVARTVVVLLSRTDAVLPDLVSPPNLSGTVRDGATGVADSIVDPRYPARAGFMHLMHHDVSAMLDLVATKKRPLVVFVDDLDRCTSSTVVQVVEALNLFLAGQYPNCVFVVAMDPEVVAAQLDVVYGSPTIGYSVGWRFLDKLVQLEFSLPSPDVAAMQGFVSTTLIGDGAHMDVDVPLSETEIREAERALGSQGSVDDVASTLRALEQDGESPALREAAKRETLRRLSVDDPEMQAILAAVSAHLGWNPREVKRVVNLVRFHAVVNLGSGPDTLSVLQLTKLALIAVRWPHLRGTLAQRIGSSGVAVLTAVENAVRPRQSGSVRGGLEAQGVDTATSVRLSAESELLAFLASNPPIGPRAIRHL